MICVLCKKEPQLVDARGHFEEDVSNRTASSKLRGPLFTLCTADVTPPLRTDVAAGLRVYG
ncbi:hypothetical protein N7460_007626 [Penicillium canescens]|uniref:Uncharacterized protein n=1 Tax=Penicillium canescens TaxID=5083 RepID=A0AAD6I9G2_PENCN|nr:hypothetical protein N7460_007626 [Penicillium canescens]